MYGVEHYTFKAGSSKFMNPQMAIYGPDLINNALIRGIILGNQNSSKHTHSRINQLVKDWEAKVDKISGK